ncbi:hypothetical protein B0920_17335 [Massilia sp. KIM]|uniref:hypothetical protein n=1 Tax=Massilia sp. KIM TaxID=1955422 RepID=UPI0009902D71|nr:hypothetical protein [Massilia sp. KIM]OON60724.1 hypothetical protein B0920_17335 [Massilia sp. KIM]
MASPDAKSRSFSVNSLFPTFVLAIFGWGMVHVWGLRAGAGVTFHAFFAIPCCVLAGLVIYRYKHHWPVPSSRQGETLAGKSRTRLRDVTSILVPVGIGLALALVVSMDSLFGLALLSIGLNCVPWTKLPICRDHFFGAVFLVEASAVLGMASPSGPALSLFHLAAASLVLVVATAAMMAIVLINGDRLDRMPLEAYPVDAIDLSAPRPAVQEASDKRLPVQ